MCYRERLKLRIIISLRKVIKMLNNNVSIGFDIGISSVGWSVLDITDGSIIESGVSIFSGKAGENNVNRRDARHSRRLNSRRKNRIVDLRRLLVKQKLLSKFDEELNIDNQYYLRVKGLNEKLSDKEIAAILLQIVKHRGISYDLGDLENEESGSSFKKSIDYNRRELKSKTPGQIQYERLLKYNKVRGNFEDTENEIALRNVFPTDNYVNEVKEILSCQKNYNSKITDDFIEKVTTIIKRKRDYFKGPGKENSRTDYGIYKTNGKTLNNLFEELIGKDKFYPDQYRAPANSYTAQIFNLLNDLNNLKITSTESGHLTKEQKLEIIKELKDKKRLSGGMLKVISDKTGTPKQEIRGYRVDEKNKPDIHSMAVYRKVRSKFLENSIDINNWPTDLIDQIAFVMTLNTDSGEIHKRLSNLKSDFSELNDESIEIILKNSEIFKISTNNKWHRFSIKMMKELIPEMEDTFKEQSTLLNERGFIKKSKDMVTPNGSINIRKITEEIYNPVVTKSIRESLKVFNKLIKKYDNIEYVIIELPRENNQDDEKKKIEKIQKENKKNKDATVKEFCQHADIKESELFYRLNKNSKLFTKIRLWYEQGGKDPYLGKNIDAYELFSNPDIFEIDHIIPRSVSFDSRLSNEVVCYASANSDKSNRTPYGFMQDATKKHQSFEEMSAWIKSNKRISFAKKNNLLFTDNIDDIEVRKRFINRNLVDTRYASRVVLNGIQSFMNESESHKNTKVSVIRGQFTSWLRRNWNIPKTRETYHHHAVDATLIAATAKVNLWEKTNSLIPSDVNSEFVDVKTGEIISDEEYRKMITVPFASKFFDEVRHLEYSDKIKFHHQVDKKFNRVVSDATIYSTRQTKLAKDKKLEEYVVGKLKNIYDVEDWKKFKKFYDKDKTKFIMFQKDPKTFEKLEKIMNEYPSREEKVMANNKIKEVEVSPFELYRRENGYITKYAKKNNGPKVVQVKYYDKKVGNRIDITHKNKNVKNKRVILQSLKPWRTDVYYNEQTDSYEIMGIKYNDLKFGNGKYGIPSSRYAEIKQEEKIDNNSKFVFSLYRNDRIKIESENKESVEVLFGSRSTSNKGYVEIKPIDKYKYEGKQEIPLYGAATPNGQMIKRLAKSGWKLWKVNTDELGNPYYIKKESNKPKNIIEN